MFRKDSIKQHVLNNKNTDSLLLAKGHFEIGEWYKKIAFLTDSAYYHYDSAEKYYRLIGDKYGVAATLYGIASIQSNEKDYTASEVTSVEAIDLLEQLPESYETQELKSFIYNNLGIVFNELEQYDESIKYHKKSLNLKQGLKGIDKSKIDNSLNNIGYVYKNMGQFDLALDFYNEILKNKNLINERPDFYALVLDNYAHALYLSNRKEQLPNLYYKALKISDSVNPNGYNSIVINQHLAEYFNDKNDKDSAKFYAYRAKEISEQFHNDDLLKSLFLLSKIETDSIASQFLKAYIKLNDSLQKNERKIRNKFARIRFETNQIEQENIKIAKERTWFLVIAMTVALASILLYLVIMQRNKYKELRFVQKQQEANEEIYNLMLSQNESIEKARTLEKRRISEELHDGVLGRLFGVRLSLDSLNMSSSTEAIKTREQYIQQLKTIEEDIRKVSHELNTDFVSGSGFVDIIKTLVETQTIAYGLTYKLKHDETINWDMASNKKKIHIYRIMQETLHNIYKHAAASHVDISFKLKNSVIWLKVTDNGIGFDVNKTKSGIGLKNIKSRIDDINGLIRITSEKTIGTTVIIEAPLT